MMESTTSTPTLLAAQMLKEANVKADELLELVLSRFSGETFTTQDIVDMQELLHDCSSFFESHVAPLIERVFDEGSEHDRWFIDALHEALKCKIRSTNYRALELACIVSEKEAMNGNFMAFIALQQREHEFRSMESIMESHALLDIALSLCGDDVVPALRSLVLSKHDCDGCSKSGDCSLEARIRSLAADNDADTRQN